MKEPQTLREAVAYFSDPDEAHKQFVEIRWPDGVCCPRDLCKSKDVREISRRRWRCGNCDRDFTAKVGTIFENSALGFDKWLAAIWFLANSKSSVSSMELHRSLGVTQKTAWHMLHRVCLAMKNRSVERLRGDVEVDETYAGGRLKQRRRSLGRPRRKQIRATRR